MRVLGSVSRATGPVRNRAKVEPIQLMPRGFEGGTLMAPDAEPVTVGLVPFKTTPSTVDRDGA